MISSLHLNGDEGSCLTQQPEIALNCSKEARGHGSSAVSGDSTAYWASLRTAG